MSKLSITFPLLELLNKSTVERSSTVLTAATMQSCRETEKKSARKKRNSTADFDKKEQAKQKYGISSHSTEKHNTS